jgi:FdhD protein
VKPSEGDQSGHPAMVEHRVMRLDGLSRSSLGIEHNDWLAQEVPIAVEINGISHAVMMASPQDLEDFAWGFLFTEQLIRQRSEVLELEVQLRDGAAMIQVRLDGKRTHDWKQRKRNLAGQTGCGVCGTTSLDHLYLPLPQLARPGAHPSIHLSEVRAAMDSLMQGQTLQHHTGAVHAAAWRDTLTGQTIVREDVGRHNALDKVIGALLQQGLPMARGLVVMTSRASYELIQKTVLAAIPLLAVVSAPTALAVQTAQTQGLTLLGFLRESRVSIYSHAQRLNSGEH